jgi:hypothetical protein
MLRVVMAGLAILGLAACAYSSDIDLAPMADRISAPVLLPGDYCEATASSPPYIVKSSVDCESISWNPSTRTYVVASDGDDEEHAPVAPVALGEDLFLLQWDDDREGESGRYNVAMALAQRSAFFLLPTLEREKIAALAAKHPGVTFVFAEDTDPVITGGELAAIKSFLKAAAREALKGANLEDEELSIAIRDRAGAPDHEANGMQTMAIIELVTAIFALQGDE